QKWCAVSLFALTLWSCPSWKCVPNLFRISRKEIERSARHRSDARLKGKEQVRQPSGMVNGNSLSEFLILPSPPALIFGLQESLLLPICAQVRFLHDRQQGLAVHEP